MKTKLLILKIGGNIIDSELQLESLLEKFALVKEPKILIHGGGKTATKLAARLKIESRFHEGRRITSREDLDIAVMVYAGLINKKIIAQLQKTGSCNAIGLTGADLNTVITVKRPAKPIDFGFVGDVECVNFKVISEFIEQGITPVFSAITHDGNGQLLNTNADTMATEIAIALSSEFEVELKFCFEKQGVLMDSEHEESIISILNEQDYIKLKEDKIIVNGMIPKLDNVFYALKNKVKSIVIGNQKEIFKKDGNYSKIQL